MNRIVFIQHGDFKQAHQNFLSGGNENYYSQKYSVDYVTQLKAKNDDVAVICLSEYYSLEVLSTGVKVVGCKVTDGYKRIYKLLDNLNPTHIICRTPKVQLIKYAQRNEVKILPLLADSFSNKNIKTWCKNKYLAYLLNKKEIKFIGNHSLNASMSLRDIGVKAEKIIPWDWPHKLSPEMFEVKTSCSKLPILFYAGQITQSKGVFDIIDALVLLNKEKCVQLQVAGKDSSGSLREYIEGKNLSSSVQLLGSIPQKEVIERMKYADIVIIPSRHEYPEGLPMTFYEALLSRTPVIVSNHKMLKDKIIEGHSGLVFEAGNYESLASKCFSLLDDSELYMKISSNTLSAWNKLRIKVEWASLVDSFIFSKLSKPEINALSLNTYSDSMDK